MEPGFVIHIPQAIYAIMVEHIETAYPNYAIGLLGSVNNYVVKNYPVKNIAKDRKKRFQVDQYDLLDISIYIQTYQGEMYFYYSNPEGNADPEEMDLFKDVIERIHIIFAWYQEDNPPKDPPYCRVFSIAEDGTVTEGKIELIF